MAMTVYATVDELTAWLEGSCAIPDNAGQLLRSATFLVANAIHESPYSDVTVTDARRDAVLAQVAAWIATNVTPGAGGINDTAVLKSKSNDGASVEYDTSLGASVTAFQARQAIANELVPEARAILEAAGLLTGDVPRWNFTPDQGVYVNEFGAVGGNLGVSGVTYR